LGLRPNRKGTWERVDVGLSVALRLPPRQSTYPGLVRPSAEPPVCTWQLEGKNIGSVTSDTEPPVVGQPNIHRFVRHSSLVILVPHTSRSDRIWLRYMLQISRELENRGISEGLG